MIIFKQFTAEARDYEVIYVTIRHKSLTKRNIAAMNTMIHKSIVPIMKTTHDNLKIIYYKKIIMRKRISNELENNN
jgi:hypothetical protein